MRRIVISVVMLALVFLTERAVQAQAPLTQLLTNGPTSKRINIVFLSEGYTMAQLGQFTNDAKNVLDRLLSTSPYSEYRGSFNAFAISVASNESGSDHPSKGIARDTYFNSSYESYGISYLVTFPPNDRDSTYADGQGKVDALLHSLMPEYDIAALVVNDTDYGGSGGGTPVASVNGSSAEIMVHELGHSLAFLGDEYETPNPGYPDTEEPNTTRETNRTSIKWRSWIAGTTPIPTPATTVYNDVPGLFLGAHYHSTGWYRPELDCKMRTLGAPFCAICAEALVLAEYRFLRPIESFSPAVTNVTSTGSNGVFAITPLAPQTHALQMQWYVDDALISGATQTNLDTAPLALSNGTHTVRVAVLDSTALVRNDPSHLLTDAVAWTLHLNAPPVAHLVSVQRLSNGSFSFTLSKNSASSFVIETSTNLISWLPVQTNNNSGTTFQFTDSATNSAQRFYRVLLKP